jgi:hypothetical protein
MSEDQKSEKPECNCGEPTEFWAHHSSSCPSWERGYEKAFIEEGSKKVIDLLENPSSHLSYGFLLSLSLSGFITEEEADEVWMRLKGTLVPRTPSLAIVNIKKIIDQVRAEKVKEYKVGDTYP